MKTESTDLVGEGCMRGNYRALYLNEKNRAKLWKPHMQNIINEKNKSGQKGDADTVE